MYGNVIYPLAHSDHEQQPNKSHINSHSYKNQHWSWNKILHIFYFSTTKIESKKGWMFKLFYKPKVKTIRVKVSTSVML